MAYRTLHGGGCCGIRHILSFGGRETVAEITSFTREADHIGCLLEVVLTNRQMQRSTTLRNRLENAGFRCVTSFRNGNSGNTCNVFHYHPNPTFHNVAVDNLPTPRVSLWRRIVQWFNKP